MSQNPHLLYERLYAYVVDEIRKGALRSGDRVPSEKELARTHGVSRITSMRALQDLERAGIVDRIRGKGTFVAPPKLRERFVQQVAGIYEDMASRGVTIRTQVLDQAIVPASKLVAPELQLVVGSPVVKLVRLRFVDDEPLILANGVTDKLLCG